MAAIENKQYPAGKYYVGDLCYVKALGDHQDRWDRICKMMFPDGRHDDPGSHTIDGIDFWYHGTAYGDGNYESSLGERFPVDAGIIGICSAEVAESEGYYGGHIIEFDEPFTPEYENGTFRLGHFEIYTDGGPWDEEDDYDPDDDDGEEG